MTAWEILLSESQERMLVVAEKGKEQTVLDIFEKWDLNCVQIGEVTEGENLDFYQGGELVAQMPAESLVLGGGAPVYHREYKEPAYYQEFKKFTISQVPEPKDLAEYQKIAEFLLSHPNICSRKWVYEQYDSMVGTANANSTEPADAGIVWVKPPQGGKPDKAIVISVDCNGRYVHADPEVGAMMAVCESARNVVCAGGEPVAITNNLNFGNPYNPEVYWQFVGSIQGIIKACEKLETPVTGGNVSFYNQSSSVSKDGGNVSNAVFPTPTIGMLGILEDPAHRMTLDFKQEGDLIYLIGEAKEDIACSEYVYNYHQIKKSTAPAFDLEQEAKLQQTVKGLIRNGHLQSAHDISEGGLFIALAESAMPRGFGFEIKTFPNIRQDAYLFGESGSRVIVSIKPENKEAFEDFMEKADFPYAALGLVSAADFKVKGETLITSAKAQDLYGNSLGRILS